MSGIQAREQAGDMAEKRIEEKIAQFPICEYAFIRPEEIPFSEKVRYICRTECPRYGTSWACPPAVGTLEECRERCLAFEKGFIFTTVSEGADLENMDAMLAMRGGHEKITRRIVEIFRENYEEVQAFSTESCAICETCSYPDAPCRHPDYMLPSVEGQGILVTELAERHGMTFLNGSNVVTWFSLILYAGEKAAL